MIPPFSSPPPLPPRAAQAAAWMCALALFVVAATAGSALVYAPISDADLFEGADRVVLGEVLEVRAAPDARLPSTDYVVWVDEELRASDSPATVTVRVPGGAGRDGMAFWIPGTPKLRVGEQILVFLADAADAESAAKSASGEVLTRLSQHTLGLFHVVEHSGHKLAARALGDATQIFLADTAGQGAKGLSRSVEPRQDWPRDLEGFLHWMRTGAGPDYEVDPKSLVPAFADKFTLLLSRADEEFGGCGETGGNPVRRFDFDEAGAEPVGWRVHFAAPQGSVASFREALDSWTNDPASSVDFTFDGLTTASGVLHSPDDVNGVRFDDPYDDIPGEFDGSGLLALGGPWFFCDLFDYGGEEFHLVAEGDIVVQNGVPEAFEATPWPDRLMVQLLAHEVGHTLGIGHTDEPEALMQAVLHLDPRGAAFDHDDLAALEYLYGVGDETQTSPPRPEAPQLTTDRGPYVQLSWAPVAGASNYRVERRRLPETWSLLTTVVEPELEDVWVDPVTTYEYRLRSQNAAGASGVSPFARIVTGPDGAPKAPSQLRAYPLDAGGIGLRWQNNSCDLEMQRLAIDSGSGYQYLLTTLAGERTELLVTGLRDDVEYGFQLSAANRWGESAPSEPVVIDELQSDGACTWRPGEPHLCLDDRRFEVSLEYWDRFRDDWLPALPRPEGSSRGFFSFFDTNNLELELSIDTDAAGLSRLRWTSLTGQPWRMTVTDTVTGVTSMHSADPSMCTDRMALPGLADASAGLAFLGKLDGSKLDLTKSGMPEDSGWQLIDVSHDRSGAGPGDKAQPPQIPCDRTSNELYLGGGRFLARLWWWDDQSVRRTARAYDLTDVTGGFEMTTNDELGWLVKVLDGRGLNDRFWLFAGPMHAAAPYVAVLEVNDLQEGVSRVYRRAAPTGDQNPEDLRACSVGDIGAFGG